jgi:hypothetical protein
MLLGEHGAQFDNRSGRTKLLIFARFDHDLRRSRSRQFLQLSGFVNPMRQTSRPVYIVRIRGIGRF